MAGEVGDCDFSRNTLGAVIGIKKGTVSVPFGPGITGVSASRTLVEADNGQFLEMLAAGLTLTVPSGLSVNWNCQIIPLGTTSIAASGTTLNGAGTTLTRAAASNVVFSIIPRVSNGNAYLVTGV